MRVHVFAKPGRRAASLAWDGALLVAAIPAPPVEGAANRELVTVLADWLQLRRRQVRVVKGQTARHKTCEIEIAPADWQAAVAALPRVPRAEKLF